ncbi:MAG: hypothetical protein HY751_10215 [Nitrospinae bacterium]|nr:hypothetical protein [Nitrospinota bacterium]
MRFTSEDHFLSAIAPAGLAQDPEGRYLRFTDEDSVLGFDFTNLTMPDSPGAFDIAGGMDNSVERSMVETVVRLMEDLDLFPLYLFASDNEWLDEDADALAKRGLIRESERDILKAIQTAGHNMDVLIVEKSEAGRAVDILTPQLTELGATCFAVSEDGSTYALISQDDEVSFNTTDEGIYRRARETVRSLESLSFDIIWGE